jgi:hypothetical protein
MNNITIQGYTPGEHDDTYGDYLVHGDRSTIPIHAQAVHADDNDQDDRDGNYDDSAEMFQNTAMSLGMDNDELLFNLLYFGGDSVGNFGTMVNNALEETVALHSENNTPYKLKPASDNELSHLEHYELEGNLSPDEEECQVCKDIMEIGNSIVRLKFCKHCFHSDCLVRWLKLQAWCPVCRDPIEQMTNHKLALSEKFEALHEAQDEYDEEVNHIYYSYHYSHVIVSRNHH